MAPVFRLSSFGGYAGLAGDKQVQGASPTSLFTLVCLATLLFFGAALAPRADGGGAIEAAVAGGGRKVLPRVAFTPAVAGTGTIQYLDGAWRTDALGSAGGSLQQEAVQEVEGERRQAQEQRQQRQSQQQQVAASKAGVEQAVGSSGTHEKDSAKQGGEAPKQQQTEQKQQPKPEQQQPQQQPKPQRTQPKGGQKVQLEIFGTSLSPDTGRCQLAMLGPMERLQSFVDISMRCAHGAHTGEGEHSAASGGRAWSMQPPAAAWRADELRTGPCDLACRRASRACTPARMQACMQLVMARSDPP